MTNPADLGTAGEPTLSIVRDGPGLADAAAVIVADALVAAVRRRGRADLCSTGGSTPPAMYRQLAAAPLRDRVPWSQVHVWLGDDRFVPRDHPLSNMFGIDEILLDEIHGVALPVANVHPWPNGEAIAGDLGPDWCANAYASEARAVVPLDPAGVPVFDLVLVGIGPDGHLMSVFPGSPAIGSDRLALGIAAPTHVEPHVPRVTFNPSILAATPAVLVMVGGESKAGLLARILDDPRIDPASPAGLPAQLARRSNATWLVDAAAAAGLRSRG